MPERLLLLTGAAIFAVLGALHLLYTFTGTRLQPRDAAAIAAMQATHPRLAPGTTVWRAWIGFNASHSMGAILFGLVYGFLANAHPQLLFNSPFLLAVGVVMLGGLAVLAKLYWFRIPFAGVGISLACYVLSIAAWHL